MRNAIEKAPDNDEIRCKAATESAQKQAQKVRQMESRIAQLDEVEEPRKEWKLRFTIGAAPRSSSVVATVNEATLHRDDFVFDPASLQIDAGDASALPDPTGRERPRCSTCCWAG